jgi:hypothetical protein
MSDTRTAEGVELTAKLAAAMLPILDGQPTDLAIEAGSAAVMTVLMAGMQTWDDRHLVLRRFAMAINRLAAMLPHDDDPVGPPV